MSNDWMPGRRQDQLAMAKNWSAILAEKGTAWGIPQPEVGILDTKITNAEAALNIAQSAERTDSTTALLAMRFKDLTDYMRHLKTTKFHKPVLSDIDYINLGLKPKDKIKSTIPIPTDAARGWTELSIRYVLIVMHEIVKGAHSDERANHGVRINYGVVVDDPAAQSAITGRQYYLASAPHSPDQLSSDEFTRRSAKKAYGFFSLGVLLRKTPRIYSNGIYSWSFTRGKTPKLSGAAG